VSRAKVTASSTIRFAVVVLAIAFVLAPSVAFSQGICTSGSGGSCPECDCVGTCGMGFYFSHALCDNNTTCDITICKTYDNYPYCNYLCCQSQQWDCPNGGGGDPCESHDCCRCPESCI
jgi:hypothetical protein